MSLVPAAIALAALCPTGTEDLAAQTRGAVVQLFVRTPEGAGSGTGFFVSESGWIITNEHVIRDATVVVVELADGTRLDAGFLAQDAQHDLALVAVDHKPSVILSAGEPPRMGQTIIVLGHPLGEPLTLTKGEIARDVSEAEETVGADVTFTAEIQPGSSGSPLLSANGLVVAVATGRSMEGHATYYATSSTHLVALLAEVDPNAEPSGFPIGAGSWLNILMSLLFVAGVLALGWWSQRKS